MYKMKKIKYCLVFKFHQATFQRSATHVAAVPLAATPVRSCRFRGFFTCRCHLMVVVSMMHLL
jgi:hypothetical protein